MVYIESVGIFDVENIFVVCVCVLVYGTLRCWPLYAGHPLASLTVFQYYYTVEHLDATFT